MRTVIQYIQTLLFEHDYVTVPNLGAFIANYQPAGYNEISGSFMPPQKRIAFNEVLRQDDGLLAMHIARRENISIEEAKRRIQNFVAEVKGRLFLDKYYSLDRIGKFSLNEENNLVFEPDRKANYYSESFGFDSLYPRRTEKEINQYNNQIILEEASDDFVPNIQRLKKPSGQYSFKNFAMYALPIFALSVGLFYIILSPKNKSIQEKNKPSLSSVNPLDYLPKGSPSTESVIDETTPPIEVNKAEIIKPVLKAPTVRVAEKKAEIITEPTPIIEKKVEITEFPKKTEVKTKNVEEEKLATTSNKHYKIIAGLFKNADNAERQKKKLIANGFESVQLVTKSTFVCVIAAEVESNEEAKKIAQKVSAVIGETAIVQ